MYGFIVADMLMGSYSTELLLFLLKHDSHHNRPSCDTVARSHPTAPFIGLPVAEHKNCSSRDASWYHLFSDRNVYEKKPFASF